MKFHARDLLRVAFPQRRFAHEIAFVLAIKFLLLWVLYAAFFSHPDESAVAVRANEVARVFMNTTSAIPTETHHDR